MTSGQTDPDIRLGAYPPHWTEDDIRLDQQERAAILEFDARLPRPQAEKLAGLLDPVQVGL